MIKFIGSNFIKFFFVYLQEREYGLAWIWVVGYSVIFAGIGSAMVVVSFVAYHLNQNGICYVELLDNRVFEVLDPAS